MELLKNKTKKNKIQNSTIDTKDNRRKTENLQTVNKNIVIKKSKKKPKSKLKMILLIIIALVSVIYFYHKCNDKEPDFSGTFNDSGF